MAVTPCLLATKEVVCMFKISDKSLERRRMDGADPKYKYVDRRELYSESDLHEWLDNNTFQSPSEYKLKEVT